MEASEDSVVGTITISEWAKMIRNQPVGYLMLSEGPGAFSVAMYKKPSRFKLFFYKWLLGWEWKNNQGVLK